MPRMVRKLTVCIPGTDFRLCKSSSQLGPWISRILLCLEDWGPLGGEQEWLLGQQPQCLHSLSTAFTEWILWLWLLWVEHCSPTTNPSHGCLTVFSFILVQCLVIPRSCVPLMTQLLAPQWSTLDFLLSPDSCIPGLFPFLPRNS